MKPVEIAKGIYDVGVVDWNIRDFHGYSTDMGSTYNAFLILDDKVTLVDTVKKEFADQLLRNISAIVDPKKIEIVISNHTEMDHSGALPRVMHTIGEDKPIYCSQMGQRNLSMHFPRDWRYRTVENGEMLSLGKRTLQFMETRMLHWPDNMFTYVKEDQILFSSDAFGQHYAGPEKFDDALDDAILHQAKKYFANILLLYAAKTRKLLETVREMGLTFKMICPDHGILWRKNPQRIIDLYAEWSEQKPKKKALVIYDTMWHSTEKMARAITETITEQGIEVKPLHLRLNHRSDIMTEVLDAAAVLVGSPTLNNCMFPTVADFLTYMKGLKPKNKFAAAFGSYGWSGEAVKMISQELEVMKFDLVDAGCRVQYVPDVAGLEQCAALGRKIAEAVNAAVKE